MYSQGHRAVKSGLARAHGMYTRSLHIAGKVNDIFQVGKKVAAIALPHLERYAPGIQAGGVKAIGQADAARGAAMHRFEDVQDQLRDHGRVWEQIKARVPQAKPYMA